MNYPSWQSTVRISQAAENAAVAQAEAEHEETLRRQRIAQGQRLIPMLAYLGLPVLAMPKPVEDHITVDGFYFTTPPREVEENPDAALYVNVEIGLALTPEEKAVLGDDEIYRAYRFVNPGYCKTSANQEMHRAQVADTLDMLAEFRQALANRIAYNAEHPLEKPGIDKSDPYTITILEQTIKAARAGDLNGSYALIYALASFFANEY